MKYNGKLQLHTFIRIAICLLVGICIGDAAADAVPVALCRWLFVGLLSVLVLLHLSKRLEMLQTLLIFGVVIAGGAWRITSYENSLRCAFTGEEEVYEYNRENEMCIFSKRNVHFLYFFRGFPARS